MNAWTRRNKTPLNLSVQEAQNWKGDPFIESFIRSKSSADRSIYPLDSGRVSKNASFRFWTYVKRSSFSIFGSRSLEFELLSTHRTMSSSCKDTPAHSMALDDFSSQSAMCVDCEENLFSSQSMHIADFILMKCDAFMRLKQFAFMHPRVVPVSGSSGHPPHLQIWQVVFEDLLVIFWSKMKKNLWWYSFYLSKGGFWTLL